MSFLGRITAGIVAAGGFAAAVEYGPKIKSKADQWNRDRIQRKCDAYEWQRVQVKRKLHQFASDSLNLSETEFVRQIDAIKKKKYKQESKLDELNKKCAACSKKFGPTQ